MEEYEALYERIERLLPLFEEFIKILDQRDERVQKLIKMYELVATHKKLKFENLQKCHDIINKTIKAYEKHKNE